MLEPAADPPPDLLPMPLPIAPFLPRVLVASWQPWPQHPHASPMMAWFRRGNLRVSMSVAVWDASRERWLHVCCSRPDCVPAYNELRAVKDQFIGADREAIQKFPRAREHVNYAPYALHLWSNLDRDVTPDFRVAGIV